MTKIPADDLILSAINGGEITAAARLISRIERGDTSTNPLLKKLYLNGGRSLMLGITGPPGAGKSTLVNQLIRAFRQQQQKVAVLAVDPSSPLSGGAILGDRVRMNQHASDPDVFIRSMAARGQLGGLAKASADALTVLDAMNFDVIIVETVGVGQSEIDILRHAHSILLLQTPDSGDNIQAVKAGLLEIGDIYIVNKADHEGSEAMQRAIADMLHNRPAPEAADAYWLPPVLCTQANSGAGLEQLVVAIEQHRLHLANHPDQALLRNKQRLRHRLLEICQQLTRQRLFSSPLSDQPLDAALEKIAARKADPYSLAAELVGPS